MKTAARSSSAASLGGGALWLRTLPPATPRVQGYVEGEYVYVPRPFAGAVRTLVGCPWRAGASRATRSLPSIPQPEQSARDEAARRLLQARAQLEDAQQGPAYLRG